MDMASVASKQSLPARRRKFVKNSGRRLFKKIDRWFARQSRVANDPVLDPAEFPWVAELERNWEVVREEILALLEHRTELPRFQDISPDQSRISPDDKWRTFFFYGFGTRAERNCKLCPETARLLAQVPAGIENAFFSILAPGKIIPEHCGITKGLIRCHLGLIVPADPARCYMDVGGVRCTWEEGRALVFDDTYPHSVSNTTDEERVVLLFDFPRPMSVRGNVARRLLFSAFRRTSYVRDALRNEARWRERQLPGLARQLGKASDEALGE
jgi:ornithine lipid ester-linked acyl 2-hydroxylase